MNNTNMVLIVVGLVATAYAAKKFRYLFDTAEQTLKSNAEEFDIGYGSEQNILLAEQEFELNA